MSPGDVSLAERTREPYNVRAVIYYYSMALGSKGKQDIVKQNKTSIS
jgi:hypothetical protein